MIDKKRKMPQRFFSGKEVLVFCFFSKDRLIGLFVVVVVIVVVVASLLL